LKKSFFICAAALLFSSASTREARADNELTFVLGAGFGGDFNVLTDPNLDLTAAFQNSPIYGIRVGKYGFPFGFEGSLTFNPSSVVGAAFNQELAANLLYAEANVLVIVLPGPISPFVTSGIGLHYVDINLADFLSLSNAKFGWNFGGGIKFNISRLALRFDVRDHVTTFGLDDFGLGTIGNLIGLTNPEARVHNVEASVSIGIRF
jgi:opacity protein-like surface antigen